ncbi:MAG: hypothetical protein EOO63_18220 [Hymenobacter sp.]|nr:MAG: hypothetical protein EOO63_18220 [Hymenobacter sp.]
MDTRTLLHWVATHEPDKKDSAFAELSADDSHYPALLQSLIQAEDASMTFWALELLVKHFPLLLQRDAKLAIPLLLPCLLRGNGLVCDRAAWALSIIGKPAVEALLAAIAAAPDASAAANYIGAIRGNYSTYTLAKQVVNSLANQLDSPNADVRYWALVVLMDIGPLRPRFDERMDKSDFEPLYGQLLTVAYDLAPHQQYEFALRYIELLEKQLDSY